MSNMNKKKVLRFNAVDIGKIVKRVERKREGNLPLFSNYEVKLLLEYLFFKPDRIFLLDVIPKTELERLFWKYLPECQGNATASALKAGYAPTSAYQSGYLNLKKRGVPSLNFSNKYRKSKSRLLLDKLNNQKKQI